MDPGWIWRGRDSRVSRIENRNDRQIYGIHGKPAEYVIIVARITRMEIFLISSPLVAR